jgi:hypothetical protein
MDANLTRTNLVFHIQIIFILKFGFFLFKPRFPNWSLSFKHFDSKIINKESMATVKKFRGKKLKIDILFKLRVLLSTSVYAALNSKITN